MGIQRTHKQRKLCPNHLPAHVARGFQDELTSLIEGLDSSYGFKGEYLQREFKSKYLDPSVVTPEQRRQAAVDKWLMTDERNAVTNCRLQLGDEDFGWVTSDNLIRKTRQIIKSTLGPLDYPACLFRGNHTNGASVRVGRSPAAAIFKHTGKALVSSSALKHWLAYASSTRLSDQVLCIQEFSVLFTVPKATEIDRVACKEPEINMFLQRSVGDVIRKRLRKNGIDLNDQTINQRLARDALHQGLATVDLSSASDSISQQLVRELLPFDWWSLLDDLRVHSTQVIEGEEPYELNMFSSMGNGFTFELESLIFWALARAISYFSGSKGKVSVYGDDIVVPNGIAPRMARVFAWFGFKVNTKKSHWSGSFRESCGKHYHRSYDVTPFYMKEPVKGKTDVIRLLNQLLYWEARDFRFFTDEKISEFHCKWSGIIPRSLWGGQDPMIHLPW